MTISTSRIANEFGMLPVQVVESTDMEDNVGYNPVAWARIPGTLAQRFPELRNKIATKPGLLTSNFFKVILAEDLSRRSATYAGLTNDIDRLRWVIAHEFAHAFQTATTPNFYETYVRHMPVWPFENHDDNPFERMADRVADEYWNLIEVTE